MQHTVEAVSQYLTSVVIPLIRYPERLILTVQTQESERCARFYLQLAASDVTRLIGANGMTVSAIRSLAKALGEKRNVVVMVHIGESSIETPPDTEHAAEPELGN